MGMTSTEISQLIKDKINQIYGTLQVNIELDCISDDYALTLSKQVRDLVCLHSDLIVKMMESKNGD